MLSLFYNKDKVAALIGDAVVGSDCQDQIAGIVCDAYVSMRATKEPMERLDIANQMFLKLNTLLTCVETFREPA